MNRHLLPGSKLLSQLNLDPIRQWPTLDPALQGQAENITDVIIYGSRPRRSIAGATVTFHTDDYRWLHIATNPAILIKRKPAQVTELNFSTSPDLPAIITLATLWYKRAIAQACQAAGIRVFVDLYTDHSLRQVIAYGLPPGWSAFWTRYTTPDHLFLDIDTARQIAAPNIPQIHLIGGGQPAKRLCKQTNTANGHQYLYWHPSRRR